MIDDDDVGLFAIAGDPGGGGCVWAGIFVAILIVLIVVASQNNDECSRRSCPDGARPKVTSHECLCVTPAR